MPSEKQQPLDINELLKDITHVNQVIKNEIKQINEQIRHRISNADLAGSVAESLIGEVSNQLGQLSAKTKLIENAIQQKRSINERKYNISATGKEVKNKQIMLRFNASQIVNNTNLLPEETSDSGIGYVWSASDPETNFLFSLDRSKTLGMQIRLFALIKPEYLKELKVLIDGIHIKHRFHMNEALSLYIVSCNLPSSTRLGETMINIVLPATHSPMDLGDSTDERKLGIAINEFCFSKPENGFSHLLRRLKLKK